ncbi:MAG: hypothetical protein ABSG95_02675 [Solirubrobacteraceae bacterium]
MEQRRLIAEVSSHIEAAERDLRSALRQLVLGEREAAHHVNREVPRGMHDPLN